jgi:hypothetical protein
MNSKINSLRDFLDKMDYTDTYYASDIRETKNYYQNNKEVSEEIGFLSRASINSNSYISYAFTVNVDFKLGRILVDTAEVYISFSNNTRNKISIELSVISVCLPTTILIQYFFCFNNIIIDKKSDIEYLTKVSHISSSSIMKLFVEFKSLVDVEKKSGLSHETIY